jgi:hypothetical protein
VLSYVRGECARVECVVWHGEMPAHAAQAVHGRYHFLRCNQYLSKLIESRKGACSRLKFYVCDPSSSRVFHVCLSVQAECTPAHCRFPTLKVGWGYANVGWGGVDSVAGRCTDGAWVAAVAVVADGEGWGVEKVLAHSFSVAGLPP